MSPSPGVRELAPRVLIVEDTSDLRELLATELERAGFAVFHAPDGTSGIKKARECEPDLIVLDLMLPDLNGLAVAHAVRDQMRRRKGHIIAVTALTSAGIRRAAAAAGCDSFIAKPTTASAVVDEVRRLSDESHVPSDSRGPSSQN